MTGSRAFPSGSVRWAAASMLLALLAAAICVLPRGTDAAEEWNSVSIIYQGDVSGYVEPCG